MSGKTTVIYISLILSLSLMGVGYAAWNQEITIHTTVTTGDATVGVDIQEGRISVENGRYLDVRVEDKNVKISGEVYPGFSNGLDIDILDKGSVPVMLKKVEGSNDADVASLNSTKKYSGLRTFSAYGKLGKDEVRESFNLNISPDFRYTDYDTYDSFEAMRTYDSYDTFETMRTYSTHDTPEETGIDYSYLESLYDEVDGLNSQIEDLNDKIQEYESIDEEYNFNYNILFEQAL